MAGNDGKTMNGTKLAYALNNKLTRHISTTNIYWRNIGYMFQPVSRSSSVSGAVQILGFQYLNST